MLDGLAQLTIRLFGAAEIHIDGTPLLLHDQKARALVFYLAATGRAFTRDHLASLLWSESPDQNARHSLRSSLYHLRQALQARGVDAPLLIEGDLISFQPGEETCDVLRFRRLLAANSERALIEAVSLYRSPLLQGFTLTDASLFDEWVRFEERELREAYLGALQHLTELAESRQSWGEAAQYLQRVAHADPLSEETQRRLIGMYLRMGENGLALRQYRQFEAALHHELGLAPSPETQSMLQTALRAQQRPKLQAKPSVRSPSGAVQKLPFIDRDNLLKQLLALSQEPLAGRGVTVLLQGEDGSGKSRLISEIVSNLSSGTTPWIVLQGSCSPFDDLLSYGPFLEAFQNADLGDLTDLLTQSQGASPDDDQGRFFWRVFQALSMLTRDTALVLTIDDLQWANSSTLQLFCLLATRLRSLPVLLVGTTQRIEAIPALQRLALSGSRHGQVHLLSVPSLSQEEATILLQSAGISQASVATMAEWLHSQSGGSPFILLEILAQLRAEAVLTAESTSPQAPAAEGATWHLDTARWLRWRASRTLPETIHDLLAWRLANLSSEAQRLLEVLAVANQPLPFDLLREFLGTQPDQLLLLLDDLLARRLVNEQESEIFALPHHLLREALVHRLSPLRQRRIHRRLAEMVEACPKFQQHMPVRQIALHAVLGEDVERARRYGLQVLANLPRDAAGAEAVDFVQHLHDLLAPTASAQEMLQITSILGQLHQLLGHLELAARWHQSYLACTVEAHDLAAQADAQFAMSELALVTTDYHAAIAAAEAGLRSCAALEEATRIELEARGHRFLGAALAMEGSDLPAAENHLQAAATAHQRTNNLTDLCATLFELGNVAAQRGELRHALEWYEEAARKAAQGHTHYFLALAYNNIAYHSLLLGRLEDARRALEQGQKVADTYELLGAFLHLLSTQGELHLYQGEWAEATEAFQQGLQLAEEVGHLERQAGYRAGLALAAQGQHQLERAATLLNEALALISGQGYEHLRTRILLWLAETLLLQGRRDEAEAHLSEGLEMARAQGRMLLLLQGERIHASLLAGRQAWPTAEKLFAEIVERAAQLELPLEQARIQAAWGQLLLRSGTSTQKGHFLLDEARHIFAAYNARAELHANHLSV
jgi:DNA-binding SARP family transcriptional activator/predicted ATPase